MTAPATPPPSSASRLRILLLVVAPLLVLATACGDGSPAADPSSSGSSAAGARSSGASGRCAYPSDGQEAAKQVDKPPAQPVADRPTRATIRTNVGNIRVTLEADQAPCTVNSFISLAGQGYFDGTPCHRLTTAGIYVLQCGDPTGTGTGGPGYAFADELLDNDPRIQPCREQQTAQGPTTVCTYGPGTVAMANSGPDTNGSQFFLVYDSSPLPANYTVFGRMDAAGLKVVKEVARAGVGTPGMSPADGEPKTRVKITGVTVAGQDD